MVDPAIWQETAARGQRYYDEWRHKDGPDRPFSHELDEIMETKLYEDTISPQTSAVMSSHGVDPHDKFWEYDSGFPVDAAFNTEKNERQWSACFAISVSSKLGVVSTDSVYCYTKDDGPTFDYHASHVYWWIWASITREQLQEARGTLPEQIDYSNLSSFWIGEIHHQGVRALLDEIFSADHAEIDVTRTFEPNDRDLSNPYWALLGSRLGTGIIHMVTENKIALRGKGIWSISANARGPANDPQARSYTMWMSIGDVA